MTVYQAILPLPGPAANRFVGSGEHLVGNGASAPPATRVRPRRNAPQLRVDAEPSGVGDGRR